MQIAEHERKYPAPRPAPGTDSPYAMGMKVTDRESASAALRNWLALFEAVLTPRERFAAESLIARLVDDESVPENSIDGEPST